MPQVPEIITHCYNPRRGPLQNICRLPRREAEAAVAKIRQARRSVRPDYLERRLETERWLLAERTRKLGRPPLEHPVYFFLGHFADGQDPSRPASLIVPLSALPPETLTFTYPDSMASLPFAKAEVDAAEREPYHGEVFTLEEIKRVVAEFGLPGRRWHAEGVAARDRFIEVQVWDERPLRSYLEKALEE